MKKSLFVLILVLAVSAGAGQERENSTNVTARISPNPQAGNVSVGAGSVMQANLSQPKALSDLHAGLKGPAEVSA